MNKSERKVRLIYKVVVLLLSCFLISASAPVRAAQLGQDQKVRVGFFEFDGYHMIDSHGRRSGYGYDYLQYLARYTNFNYEYVGYDQSWSEMQDMLEAGEIDLLTSAQKSEDRLERFDFSERPIGSSAAILTVKAGNDRYMVDDYSQLNGIRIGLLEGNSRNNDLEQFALDNGFTYLPVYYEDSGALTEALQNGDEVDAVLTSNLRKIHNEWIIATFNDTPFYIMVRKGNQRLLDEINTAIGKLKQDHKDLDSILYDRYYAVESRNEISYTAEERAYIKSWRESGDKIRVTINSGREPVSYFVDGEARGIIPEIAREVLGRTGLPYEFVDTPPTVDAMQLLVGGEAAVRFDGSSDFNLAEDNGLRVTDPYLELPLSCVTLKSHAGNPESVAVISNSDVVEEYVEQVYDEADIVRYDSASDTLNAVLTGAQDAAFFQTYIAQRLVNEDDRNRIKEQLVPGYGMSFAVAVNRENPLLFSILDKAVFSMNQEDINRIVLEQTSYLARSLSLMGYLYANPVLWLALLAGAACFAFLLLLYFFRQRNLRLERERAKEFERFISYVCRANDNVVEIRPAERACRSYQVEGGKVVCHEMTLNGDVLEIRGLHPDDRDNVEKLTGEEEIKKLMDTGCELYFECRTRRENSEDRYQWFAYTLQGVPHTEEPAGSLMIFIKNIDHAKKEEEEKRQALQDALTAAMQASEARGTFLSRMSHEIRTPLNAIIGYLTIAGSNLQDSSKIQECLKKSEFSARQLLNIVNDVLDISAIESGKMKIAHERFNIRQLLSGITSIFHTQAEDKNVRFRVRIRELTEEILIGDQLRLNQILINLLSNAVKFTPPGGQVTLTIVQKAVVDRSVYYQISVADNGIGMSKDFKNRLFEPFEQQDASTARRFGGTGLGLSITRNLVSMMNGTIDVKSEEGKGTVFTVNLPFDIEQEHRLGAAELYDFTSLRILAVYDENSDYRYMQTLLNRLGVTYDISLKPGDALRRIADKKEKGQGYDLCLIDWDIPNVSGLELGKRILAAAAPDKPALLAVAYQEPAEKALIDAVILKPVFQSSLYDVLSNCCTLQRPEEDSEAGREDYGLEGIRILLAEDNVLNMEIAKEILSGHGLLIDGAENGRLAAEKFEKSKEGTYQAILMDIQMPVLNGYEAAGRIRSCGHPQAESIPIIALTADAFTEDINRALAAGMNGHVSKPIDFTHLCEVLTQNIFGK